MRPADLQFQGARLRQARLAAGMTAAQLADKLAVSRQALSAAEAGKAPGISTLEEIADIVGVGVDFFYQAIPTEATLPTSAIQFRALQRAPEFQKARTITALDWAAELAHRFGELLELPAASLPAIAECAPESITNEDIEAAAAATRRHFGLGVGPIDRLMLLLENHGVIVGCADISDDMDGVSAWYQDRPIILVRASATAARARFDVAHELGHLVLHRHLMQEDIDDAERHKLLEKQAHYFAGAFLLPEEGYVPEAVRVDLNYLVTLKRRWGVSVQAQIQRLKALGLLSVHQVTRLYQDLSRRNWRRCEPLDSETPVERPMLLRRAAGFLEENQVLPFHEAFLRSRFPRQFLSKIAGLDDGELDPPDLQTTNVVQFRRKQP